MIPVIFEDDDLLLLDKPAGLLTIPGRTPDKADCLWTRLREAYPADQILLVHRLDRDTSGLILFAKTREAQAELGRAFARRNIEKTYLAVVHGIPDAPEGRIDAPLRKDWTRNDPPVYIVDPERGKSAVTRWQRLQSASGCALLALFPETGRSHQLRVHMLSIGHPIVGDPIYGPPEDPPGFRLHAAALAFAHPRSGVRLSFAAPPPFTFP